MSRIFLIADTHFGHEAIISYENRPFSSVEEMDQVLIDRWNERVEEDDQIFVLGDFALASPERILELIERLHGRKVLILGNHDRSHSLEWWKTSGFELVSPYPILLEEWFLLSHEPLYMNQNMPYANLFGHVHGSPLFRDDSTHHFCVSCERIGYQPIELREVQERIQKQNQRAAKKELEENPSQETEVFQ